MSFCLIWWASAHAVPGGVVVLACAALVIVAKGRISRIHLATCLSSYKRAVLRSLRRGYEPLPPREMLPFGGLLCLVHHQRPRQRSMPVANKHPHPTVGRNEAVTLRELH
jgi:hypothetical protein